MHQLEAALTCKAAGQLPGGDHVAHPTLTPPYACSMRSMWHTRSGRRSQPLWATPVSSRESGK